MQMENASIHDANDLALMIQNRNRLREAQSDKFFANLLEKYGSDDKPTNKRTKKSSVKVTKKKKT